MLQVLIASIDRLRRPPKRSSTASGRMPMGQILPTSGFRCAACGASSSRIPDNPRYLLTERGIGYRLASTGLIEPFDFRPTFASACFLLFGAVALPPLIALAVDPFLLGRTASARLAWVPLGCSSWRSALQSGLLLWQSSAPAPLPADIQRARRARGAGRAPRRPRRGRDCQQPPAPPGHNPRRTESADRRRLQPSSAQCQSRVRPSRPRPARWPRRGRVTGDPTWHLAVFSAAGDEVLPEGVYGDEPSTASEPPGDLHRWAASAGSAPWK